MYIVLQVDITRVTGIFIFVLLSKKRCVDLKTSRINGIGSFQTTKTSPLEFISDHLRCVEHRYNVYSLYIDRLTTARANGKNEISKIKKFTNVSEFLFRFTSNTRRYRTTSAIHHLIFFERDVN